jgi:hypothetical protein
MVNEQGPTDRYNKHLGQRLHALQCLADAQQLRLQRLHVRQQRLALALMHVLPQPRHLRGQRQVVRCTLDLLVSRCLYDHW